ncbi:putative dihydrodipicolinate reductase domain protein [Leptospira interrogans serovar Grippotyphosa str. LT2186]|uniref:Putative dihydrodipicolinate reductase domain protein n=1 Tax=Leptospira interrogans serovar Grippotyphosa str. LT2186 TaxID=1001599 RepID=M3I7Y6_LEPIR|nr:putative dihydrodipicolinate reductase domain protein [Leptospira interrogans serovar Grippotyphosa str. LT2186]
MSRVKVAVLGATGSVGQRFIQLLDHHPFFEITHLCASENSAGKTYGEVMKTRWKISSDIPAYAKNLVITTPDPAKTKDVVLAFSGLDSNVAGEVEKIMQTPVFISFLILKIIEWIRRFRFFLRR